VPGKAADVTAGLDLADAIAALEEGHRQVVLLRLCYGFDTEETAKLLGLTRDAVRGRLKRARAVLRETLGGPASKARSELL
jgi:RNA polymerase sigma-70 factor (ECF subfamily)